MQIIDSHQHFWKINRGDYFWMDDSVDAIRHDLLPPDLANIISLQCVSATVAVQAAPTIAETRFLISLSEKYDWIKGIVGWVDLGKPDAIKHIDELAQCPAVKGIRPMLQDIEDSNWILQTAVLRNLEYLARTGLSLDALITPRHLAVIDKLARHIPQLSIVIDHCAKPVIANGSDAGDIWRDGMQRLAEHQQIFCKLSGLANEYGAGWNASCLSPVSDHVIKAFGSERVMWGSDWPVLELEGRYDNWLDTAKELTLSLSDTERHELFSGTATRFYRLDTN